MHKLYIIERMQGLLLASPVREHRGPIMPEAEIKVSCEIEGISKPGWSLMTGVSTNAPRNVGRYGAR